MSEPKLLELLFPEGYPSDWDYDNKIQEYLRKLGTYNVDTLIKEPDCLKHEANVLQDQIQDLAIRNYKTFIETAECSRELFSQFNLIEIKLDKLIKNIPIFESKCKLFSEKSNGIDKLRKSNSLTLTKSAQLLELLELPQLMNSFIHDGLYEDALELAAYVRKLHHKHPEIPIFKLISDDIDKAWFLMLHQLLSQLRQDLSLPKCLQIVGHLRRMDFFSEPELRLKFLQTRNHWLENCLNCIPKDDVNHHLTKTIEVTRVNLFNILTQYRAIFNDDEHNPLSLSSVQNINQNLIFFTWIRDKISVFLVTLEEDLKQISSLETILDQCMYFGLSFSKVGCDFRTSMIPIFTSTILSNFKKSTSEAEKSFELNIDRFTLIDKNHPHLPWKMKNEDYLQPPDSLLEFYPLADFLNNVLNALNKLKLCPVMAIVNDVVECLQESLLAISKSLIVLYNQEQQAFTVSSKDAFTRLCMSFSDDLVPYIQKCIHIIYPPTHIASKLGISVNCLQEEGITFLDKTSVIEPINHLLPVKIDPNFILNLSNLTVKENTDGNIECEIKANENIVENTNDNENNKEETQVTEPKEGVKLPKEL